MHVLHLRRLLVLLQRHLVELALLFVLLVVQLPLRVTCELALFGDGRCVEARQWHPLVHPSV